VDWLNGHSQFDCVVRRMNEILFCPEIPLGRLNGSMAEEQLNLFKLAATGAT